MIQKESVISWFKSLDGDDRIDLMCNLLDCCLPWEIRFLGTFIEAQVQRDYPAFRQPESTANNPFDLSCLTCLYDVHVRRRLCVSLALLHSSNRQAASVLFGILNDFQPSSLGEEEFFTELSLLITMSAHHPAFSFHQKHTLSAKLKQLKQSANHTSDLSETVSEASSGSSNFSCDQDASAKKDARDDLLFEEKQTKESVEEKATVNEIRKVESANVGDSSLAKDNTLKELPVFVKEIKVQGVQAVEKKREKRSKHDPRKRDDHCYVLQVSWSDNTTETIHRTYEEMFDFQCKLRKMYPNKVDASGNPWKLPFLPGRIRMFNKPEPKGEKLPIPDISEYTRLFSSLPEFVRGCDHVVKFFQSEKRIRRKSDNKKNKSVAKTEEQSNCKNKQNEFESPHKIAEAVREQSLGRKDKVKSADVTSTKIKKKTNSESSAENVSKNNDTCIVGRESHVDIDENGNEVKSILCETSKEKEESEKSVSSDQHHKNGIIKMAPIQTLLPSSSSLSTSGSLLTSTQVSLPVKQPFHSAVQPSNSMLHMLNTNGYSLPPSLTSLQITLPSSPIASYPSPSPSPITSPVMSPANSPSLSQRSCSGNINWTLRQHSRGVNVCDWLRNLRLHKYSEVFKGKTFNEMLQFSDRDFEKLGLTAGARKKLQMNLEVLRTRGCFTSNGLTLVDILPSPSSFPVNLAQSYGSDCEFLRSVSESDSASDCGSDILSEPATQTCSSIYPRKFPALNGCHVSCYNCGSLGHVGGQCMAPNLDKRIPSSYGIHSRYDAQLEC